MDNQQESIHIFAEEAKAGLSDLILSQNFVISSGPAIPSKSDISKLSLERIITASSNIALPDLYFVDAILVSTGLNLNDDFFDSEETWAAKDSPLHKPFDFEHKSSDIVGHIVACDVWDFEGNKIEANEAPDCFEIPFTGAIYRNYPDNKSKQDRTNKIIAAIENPKEDDKWFVSMECRFRGFDYLMFPQGAESSNAKLVERNDNTAFLTKHLRAYGGTGVYKGNRVGRVLRNITFSGVGFVRHPGNPRSIILAPSKGTTCGKIDTVSEALGYDTNSEEIMNEKELETVKAQLAQAHKELDEIKKSNWEKQVTELNTVVADLNSKLDAEKATVIASKAEVDSAKAALVKIEDEKKAIAEQLEKFKTEAAQAEADRKQHERLAKVKEAYSLASDEEAKKVADPLTALTDEAFAAHIEVIKSFKKVEVKVEPKVEVKTEKVDAAVLDNAEEVVEVDVNVGGNQGDNAMAALQAELVDFFNIGKEEVEAEASEKPKKKTKVKNK